MLFCSSDIRTNYREDAVGLLADSFIDPFAHITIRENDLFGVSGNSLDYFTVKGTTVIDFRADNDNKF